MRIKYGPIEHRPKCPLCGQPVRWYGHKASKLFFNTCCHEHEVIMRKRNIKKAVNEKYGVDNVFLATAIKEKCKNTWLSNYGVDNPQKAKIIKEKSQITCLERYGITNGGGLLQAIEKAFKTKLANFGTLENLYKHNDEVAKLHLLMTYGDAHYNNMQKIEKPACYVTVLIAF